MYVTFEYPTTTDAQLFADVNIVPTLSGLDGHAATVTVTDLVSGGLPAGLTVDPSTGAIRGTALQPGRYSLGANLTASGVEGNVTTSFDIVVHSDVDVSYGSLAPTVFVGNALPSMSPTLSGILPGDVLRFSQSPTQPLAAGLSIDPLTGVISGTPRVPPGTYWAPVRLTLTRGAHTVVLPFNGITLVVR